MTDGNETPVTPVVPPAPLEDVQPPPPPPPPPMPRRLTMAEFCAGYGPSGQSGKLLSDLTWDQLPDVVLGVIGPGKVTAHKAAHRHRCWTVAKRDGKWQIEAGFNASDTEKLGYLITQNPWSHLDDVVLQ